jgi:hypothetical protein
VQIGWVQATLFRVGPEMWTRCGREMERYI